MRGVHFSPKNGEVGKIKVVEEGCSGQGTYEWLLLIFVFTNRGNITIQSRYIRVTSFNIYPNFWVGNRF